MQLPQVRSWAEEGPYCSRLMDFLRDHSDMLDRVAVEMYAQGLSVRNIGDALTQATGDLLLQTALSELTDTLWKYYETFCQRDLSAFEVE